MQALVPIVLSPAHSFSLRPDVGALSLALLSKGGEGLLTEGTPRIGVPLQPMLAKPASSVGEVMLRMGGGSVAAEYKYDGQRAQLHKGGGGRVLIFSRRSEEMSGKYPDVLLALSRCGGRRGEGGGGEGSRDGMGGDGSGGGGSETGKETSVQRAISSAVK